MTNNQTTLELQNYLDQNLYEYYEQWKTDQGFNNDTIALNYLLADFFEIQYPVNRFEIHQRLYKFEQQLTNLTQQVESLIKLFNQNGESDLNISAPKLTNSTNSNSQKTAKKTSRKTQQKTKSISAENDYEKMNKKELFALLTKRNITHRIAPKDRLKRKEEMIADLLAFDQKQD